MEKQLFENYSQAQLIEALEANSDAIEEMDYTEVLTRDELTEMKDSLALRSIEESRLLDEKKEALQEYKDKLKPISEEKYRLLDEIKHGSRSIYGKVYKIIENDRAGYYNSRGQLVRERLARPEEKQLTIAHSRRNAEK